MNASPVRFGSILIGDLKKLPKPGNQDLFAYRKSAFDGHIEGVLLRDDADVHGKGTLWPDSLRASYLFGVPHIQSAISNPRDQSSAEDTPVKPRSKAVEGAHRIFGQILPEQYEAGVIGGTTPPEIVQMISPEAFNIFQYLMNQLKKGKGTIQNPLRVADHILKHYPGRPAGQYPYFPAFTEVRDILARAEKLSRKDDPLNWKHGSGQVTNFDIINAYTEYHEERERKKPTGRVQYTG